MKNNKRSFLSFNLGDEIFALDVSNALEVLEMQKITKVPKTPDYIKGVVNFRGEILPVMDTRLKLNMLDETPIEECVIIVLDIKLNKNDVLIGAVANSVKDVLSIADNEIEVVPEMGSKYNTEFLLGMIKSKETEEFIMLLDIEKIFSVDELLIINEDNNSESDDAVSAKV